MTTILSNETSGDPEASARLKVLADKYWDDQAALEESRKALYEFIREANRIHGLYQRVIAKIVRLTKGRVNGIIKDLDARDRKGAS